MQIKSLKYKQFEGHERFWNLQEINFERINLLVGKNASGKSKTLHVINGLSGILGENIALPFSEGDYDIAFKKDNQSYEYILRYHNLKITEEKLLLDEKILIDRKENGSGIIMSSIPLAIPFGLFSLWAFDQTLNIYSMIGMLVLFGVVKKNAILQVDYTNTLVAQGKARACESVSFTCLILRILI